MLLYFKKRKFLIEKIREYRNCISGFRERLNNARNENARQFSKLLLNEAQSLATAIQFPLQGIIEKEKELSKREERLKAREDDVRAREIAILTLERVSK